MLTHLQSGHRIFLIILPVSLVYYLLPMFKKGKYLIFRTYQFNGKIIQGGKEIVKKLACLIICHFKFLTKIVLKNKLPVTTGSCMHA